MGMTSTSNTIEPMTASNELECAKPLIKTDRLGRIQIKPQHREALLDKFEQSGMSGQQFAKLHGIKYPTFASWNQKRRRSRGTYPEVADAHDHQLVNSLTEVVSLGSHMSNEVKLQLGGKVELSLTSEEQIPLVSKLIAALQVHVS